MNVSSCVDIPSPRPLRLRAFSLNLPSMQCLDVVNPSHISSTASLLPASSPFMLVSARIASLPMAVLSQLSSLPMAVLSQLSSLNET